jgi:hypothetical protein
MTSSLVFNHHSLPFDDNEAADAAIPDFLKICIGAQNNGIPTLRVHEAVDPSLFRVLLSHEYYWQDWYCANNTDEKRKDLARAFRSVATKTPFFDHRDLDDGCRSLYDVSLEGNKGYSAVVAAFWHKAPLVGFATREPWDTSPLRVSVDSINAETGDLETYEEDILNFFEYDAFVSKIAELRSKRNNMILSGKQVALDFERDYPLLVLCEKARRQLEQWTAPENVLNQVLETLSQLNAFVQQWKDGRYPSCKADHLRESGLSFNVSSESDPVKDSPKLRKMREFWLPSGKKEYFFDHVKLTLGYRLHFLPDDSQKIYVGYIGPHLRTR